MSRNAIITTIVGFFALSFAVYGLSLNNHFVAWDDNYLIVSNPIIKGFSWKNTVNAFTTFDPELYDPLIFIVYQLNFAIGGIDPFMFHFTNLVLHTLNALFVCWLLMMLTRRKWLAIFGGLLFAIHPLNTEAVSWAAALKDVLSTLFFLTSIIAYLRYRDDGGHRWLLYGLSLLLFLLGLLSKVMVLTLPVVLVLVDILQNRQWSKTMIFEKIPYCILSIIFGIVALFGKQDVVLESTTYEKILMAAKSAAFYPWSYIWPVRLSVLYPYSDAITIASPDFFVPVLLVVASLAVMILCFRNYRTVSIGIAFYLLTLVPTFFNFAKGGYAYVASDRYAYIPQIGLLLILLFLMSHLLQKLSFTHARETVIAACGIVIILLSVLTYHQSLTWRNTETLFLQTLKYHPDAQAARLNLGYVYRESEMFDKALEQFNIVIAREPDNALAYVNIGHVYEKQYRIDDAVAAYKKAVELNPRERDAYMSLGMLYERQGMIDEAFALYKEVEKINPLYAPVYNNLGSVYMQKNDVESAKESYKKAIEINPYYADAHYNLAYILAKEGNLTGAAEEYEATLSLEGDKVETLTTLASIYAELNNTAQTVRTLERILNIEPTNAFAIRFMDAIESSGLR